MITRLARVRESRTARDAAWALANDGAALVGLTVSFLLLGRNLGSEGYGGYVGLYAMISICSAVAAGAMLATLDHVVRQNEPVEDIAATGLSVVSATNLIACLAISAAGPYVVENISLFAIVSLCIAELLLPSIRTVLAAALQASIGFSSAAKVWISNTVVRVGVIIAVDVAGPLTLDRLAAALLITSIVHTIATHRYVQRCIGKPITFRRPQLRFLKTVGTYVTGIVAYCVQNDADKIVLNASNYTRDAGVYGAAYRLVSLGSIPINALGSATHVRFLDSGSSVRDVRRRALRYSAISSVYAVAFGAVVIVASPLIPKLLGDDFEDAGMMMRWLLPLVLLRGIANFPMNGLLAIGRLAARTRIGVLNSIATVGLYLVLVPAFSWKGAAIATFISEATQALSAWLVFCLCGRVEPRT